MTTHGKSLVKAPTTQTRRTISVPEALVDNIQSHWDLFGELGPDGLLFTGITGVPLKAGPLQHSRHRKIGIPDAVTDSEWLGGS